MPSMRDIEVGKGYEVHIRMKMVMAQLIKKTE